MNNGKEVVSKEIMNQILNQADEEMIKSQNCGRCGKELGDHVFTIILSNLRPSGVCQNKYYIFICGQCKEDMGDDFDEMVKRIDAILSGNPIRNME